MEDFEPPDHHPTFDYVSPLSYMFNAYGGVIIVHCISKKDLRHGKIKGILSLRGAASLSDFTLRQLLYSAPLLQSVNLSQCTLLTCDGIKILADYLQRSLKELYIDECPGIDARSCFKSIMLFEQLEVLSLDGIQHVDDAFVTLVTSACGRNLKELNLANCERLTDRPVELPPVPPFRQGSEQSKKSIEIIEARLELPAPGSSSPAPPQLPAGSVNSRAALHAIPSTPRPAELPPVPRFREGSKQMYDFFKRLIEAAT